MLNPVPDVFLEGSMELEREEKKGYSKLKINDKIKIFKFRIIFRKINFNSSNTFKDRILCLSS